MPQDGQARCVWIGAPHAGQVVVAGISAFFCALRMRIFILDFLRFGTAMAFLRYFLGVLGFLVLPGGVWVS